MIRFVLDDRSGHPHAGVSRREWLRVGGLAGLTLTLGSGGTSRAAGEHEVQASPGFGRAKSVIVVFCNGGQSQFETWDPKPDAPLEVRGTLSAISTAVPGTFLSEGLPRLARLADRYALVRGVSHDDLDHGSAVYLALTGRYHPRKSSNPAPGKDDFPCQGATLARVRPSRLWPYSAVHVNGPALVPELPAPGQDGGFLGREYDPLLIGDVSGALGAVPGLIPLHELLPVRVEARRSLLDALDTHRRQWLDDPAMRGMAGLYRQAYEFLDTPRCREAFDLSAESPSTRERYGLHRSGQACLLARRLAEAEVPWINVFWNHSARGQDKLPDDLDAYGWDTHNDIFDIYREHLLPRFDHSLSALLEDLEQRGLLDQTLVVCMGEFGRAPRVANESRFAGTLPGRKHWANVYSILVAGAGVTPGLVHGSSDRFGAYPTSGRVGPWDVAATMMAALGVDPSLEYLDSQARPFPLTIGRPISGLYQG